MTEEIMALCKAMGAAEGQEELLRPLAQAVEKALAGRLKQGVTAEDCGTAFPLAVAMVVMDGLERMTGISQVTSFSAGAVSIQTSGSGNGETSLTSQAERLLAPWLGETGFAFQGVRG